MLKRIIEDFVFWRVWDKLASKMAGPIGRGQQGATGQEGPTARPVFVKVRDLPEDNGEEYKVSGLCIACEEVSGSITMEGAQRIGGLWKLYPSTLEARVKLLAQSITLRGMSVTLSDTKPFIIRGTNGQETLTTRVLISDVPLSHTNKDIEATLLKLGCQLMSPLRYDRWQGHCWEVNSLQNR